MTVKSRLKNNNLFYFWFLNMKTKINVTNKPQN